MFGLQNLASVQLKKQKNRLYESTFLKKSVVKYRKGKKGKTMYETKGMHYMGRFMYGLVSVFVSSMCAVLLFESSEQGAKYVFSMMVVIHVALYTESLKQDRVKSRHIYTLSKVKRGYWLIMPSFVWVLLVIEEWKNPNMVTIAMIGLISILLYRTCRFLWSSKEVLSAEIYNRELILYGRRGVCILKASLYDDHLRIRSAVERLPGISEIEVCYNQEKYLIPFDISGYFLFKEMLLEQWEYAKLANN